MRFVEHVGGRIPAHDYQFNRVTALLAERIAQLLGATKPIQSQAFIGGFVHDRIRHVSNAPHAEESADFTQKIIEKRFGKRPVARIVKAARLHDKIPGEFKKNLVWASVALADDVPKFGAIGAFRRSLFQAQKKENIKRVAEEQGRRPQTEPGQVERELAIKIIIERTNAMTKEHWKPDRYPGFMQKYMQRQFEMHNMFRQGLEKSEPWAVNLAWEMYKAGKKGTGLKEAIEGYKPIAREDSEFREQALTFLNNPEKLF